MSVPALQIAVCNDYSKALSRRPLSQLVFAPFIFTFELAMSVGVEPTHESVLVHFPYLSLKAVYQYTPVDAPTSYPYQDSPCKINQIKLLFREVLRFWQPSRTEPITLRLMSPQRC